MHGEKKSKPERERDRERKYPQPQTIVPAMLKRTPSSKFHFKTFQLGSAGCKFRRNKKYNF